MNSQQKEDSATLEILQVIENKEDVTQRHIADKLDVALGLANSYLKRCVHKGLVKIHQAPANRYFYYLTPKGFSEKSRLTAEYLSSSFDFYRRASDSFRELINVYKLNSTSKIVLCGISELAEIASLRVSEYQVNLLGYMDKTYESQNYLGKPVWPDINSIPELDYCILTDLIDPIRTYSELLSSVNENKILIPSILGVNKVNFKKQ